MKALLVGSLLLGCGGQPSSEVKSTQMGIHAHRVRSALAMVTRAHTVELLKWNLAKLNLQVVKMRSEYLRQFRELTQHTHEFLPPHGSKYNSLVAFETMATISRQRQEQYENTANFVTTELEKIRKRTAPREVREALVTIMQTLPLPPA